MQLGLSEIPTIELAHLSKAERRAYVIADPPYKKKIADMSAVPVPFSIESLQ